MEKYKELYDLSKELLFEEQNRFNRIDQKASLYLSALTLIMGLTGYYVAWIIDKFLPPNGILAWFLLISGIGLAASIITTWFLCFSVHRIHLVVKIPLNTEMIEFFDNNELIDIYYALAKGNQAAYEKNITTTNRKSEKLVVSYKMMIFSMLMLIFFSIFYGAYNWSEKMENKPQSDSVTTGTQVNQQVAQSKPNSQVVNPC